MQIILTAREHSLLTAWQKHCADLEGVVIHDGSILEIACDAVVSPANSFGFMDGGIDRLYSRHFGWHVQERLQEHIRLYHQGELLVGKAEIVETDDLRSPFLIAAPTMRVPMILKATVNPYLAARAVLLLIATDDFRAGRLKGTPVRDIVKKVAFPGLGTGAGRVPPDICARQVREAIREVALGQRTFPPTWGDAQKRHQRMCSDSTNDLQRDEL